jgi:sulfur carrier protein
MSEVEVRVNGEPMLVESASTIADVVTRLTDSADPKGIAVAVDRDVVPRSQWASTLVRADTSIEVVTAAAGG